MYYPYLYGRAEELRALQARATDFGIPQRITPVIEPALKPGGDPASYAASLTRTMAAFADAGMAVHVVLNPQRMGFADAATVTAWRASMGAAFHESHVRPTLLVTANTSQRDVHLFANDFAGQSLGLVVTKSAGMPAADLARALRVATPITFLLPGVAEGEHVKAFGNGGVVRVEDNFKTQARNADYAGAELLATNHRTFSQSGFAGFGDFTVLSSELTFGGGPVGAAVIHLTYQHNGDLWVEHFVSDERDRRTGNYPSKLLEALAHMQSAMANQPGKFEASPAVADYQGQLATQAATSPAKNKRLQVEHHLFVVARILSL